MRAYLVCFFCLTLMAGPLRAQSGRQTSKANPEGALLFRQNCAACHGNDGRGGERAPNIATEHDVAAASDAQLKDTVGHGIPEAGMPAFDFLGSQKVSDLVAWLRVLQGVGGALHPKLPGDPAAGEMIFFGKAACSKCHMVRGRGGFIAEDLSDYGRGRTVDAIRTAIVNPAVSHGGGGHLTKVVMSNGATYKGVVRAEDNFTIVLQSESGAFQSLARDHIARVESSPSLMPQDYGKTLTDQELNDVVSYLIKSATPIQPMRITQNDTQ